MSHINGSKSSAAETGENGEFKRLAAGFRDWIGPGQKYPPEGTQCKS